MHSVPLDSLGDRRTFYEWSKFGWKRHSLECDLAFFHPASVQRAYWIAEGATLGVETPTAHVKDTVQRFWACTSLIKSNLSTYPPLVGVPTGEGVNLVDGHHRLAAMIYVGPIDGLTLEIWIGSTGGF